MSWIMVRADFDPLPIDTSPIIDIFRDFGVENTLEDENGLQGCVVEVEGSDVVAANLKQSLMAAGAKQVTVEPYIEQDWEQVWRQYFKPRRVGKRFLVVPSWESFQEEPGDVVLVLDPGQAFGTGDHPTTRLCLELLETIDLDGKRVADVGCGSGILGIGCVKLGAEVVAVDIDPVALEVTRENAERNGVVLETYCGDGLNRLVEEPSARDLSKTPQDETPLVGGESPESEEPPVGKMFDVVVSNIISATLIRLADQVSSVLAPGGSWIVSGIIEQNWPLVELCVRDLGFKLHSIVKEDGWIAALLVKEVPA